MIKKVTVAALLGASLLAAAPANAAIFASVVVDGVDLNTTPNSTLDGGTGLYNATFSNSNVMVQIASTGVGSSPFAAQDPNFLTQALSVNATGSHTFDIRISQVGLNSPAQTFSTATSFNVLQGTLTGNATSASYLGQSNTAYQQSNQLGTTLLCATSTCNSGTQVTTVAHGAPFSETVRYQFTLVNGRIQANTQIAGAVPEPQTWGMMLLGFGLIGAASRRARKVTTVLA